MVIVTGLSGSGKSTAIRALEDLGYFCVDNLPLVLLDKFLALTETTADIRRVALGIDARERVFLDRFQESVQRAQEAGHRVDVLFLDASDDVILRRFSETRRRHPLETAQGSVAAGIAREREMLASVREYAGWVIDTTELNLHQLKSLVAGAYAGGTARMGVTLLSFGYKHGTPREADYVLDCRLLPNPYFVEGLRPLTGMDAEVVGFLEGRDEWASFLDRVNALLEFAVPLHEAEGKPLLTVAFGCTGGQHRSVAVAETVGRHLRAKGFEVRVVHRDAVKGN